MHQPPEIDQIIQDILSDMPLAEKSAIANLDEEYIPYLQDAFDVYVRSQQGKEHVLGEDVMHRIWRKLQETHRIRCVK